MNKKVWIWVGVVLLTAATIFVFPVWSDEKTAPKWIELDAVTQATTRYEPMKFDHEGHPEDLGVACSGCHHKWDREKMDSPANCVTCHGYEAKVTLLQAFHGTCRGCHQDNEMGPVRCLECHRERE